jgi:hypothetical protein
VVPEVEMARWAASKRFARTQAFSVELVRWFDAAPMTYQWAEKSNSILRRAGR